MRVDLEAWELREPTKEAVYDNFLTDVSESQQNVSLARKSEVRFKL